MEMMMAAWASQTIAAVTRLGVPDLVGKHGPLTARQLTGDHGVDARPDFLERALRACASVGVFTEAPDGRFGPTPLSAVLTRDAPGSVRDFVELIGGRWWQLFGALPDALRTGRNQSKAVTGREPWEPTDARRTEQFGRAMTSGVESMRGVLEHHDFSRARTVVDVGGGFGRLAIAILQGYPHLRASVLERPDVVAIAERYAADEDAAVRARLSFVSGDMFTDVPPGDVYVLRRIIHDWDDQHVLRVLRNCRARLPEDGRLLCVDNVLPPLGDTGCSGTKLLDMLMMVSLPGKERTEPEWRALYEAAGLAVRSITRINPRSGESIVEGVIR
jgi:hypothetical protein